MPIVYCPACGQEALVLMGGAPQRTCSTCRQVFWTDTKRQPLRRRGAPSNENAQKSVQIRSDA